MSNRLAGKRALITGAGQGIGRAMALMFHEEGAEVVAVSRTTEKMADLAAHGIHTEGLDVTDAAAVADVIERWGPLDVLVNCAGYVHNGTILDCSIEDWQRSLDQNLSSIYYTTKAALPSMRTRHSGVILNIASVASSITGVANRAAYGAAKAGVIGLTKAVARDFVGDGIRCIALCPGTTETPSLTSRIEASPDPEATRKAFSARQPIGRLGKPEEIAATALHLVSDEAAFVTGTVIVADGGQTM